MTSIRVTWFDMAFECESRLFWSIFFLSQVASSTSFSTLTVTPSPVVKRSLGTPLILYSQSIYFRGSPLEFLSFPPCYRSRYRLSLCSAGIHSSHTIPDETWQFSLSFYLSLCIFYIYFSHYSVQILFPSIPFKTCARHAM